MPSSAAFGRLAQSNPLACRSLRHGYPIQSHHRLELEPERLRQVPCRDAGPASADTRFGHFDVVELDNGVSLDFADAEGAIRPQHYAFLISEAEFDAVLGRIKDRGLGYWADPRGSRPGEINHNAGGRGVYFRDPDGHYLEVITRPYGSGG